MEIPPILLCINSNNITSKSDLEIEYRNVNNSMKMKVSSAIVEKNISLQWKYITNIATITLLTSIIYNLQNVHKRTRKKTIYLRPPVAS